MLIEQASDVPSIIFLMDFLLVEESIVPATQRIILKIVRFQLTRGRRSLAPVIIILTSKISFFIWITSTKLFTLNKPESFIQNI